MFKITINSKTIFSFGNIIATLIYIFAISSPYWTAKQNDGSTGVFESQSQHSNSLYYTSCTDDMSQLDCGFLYAAKFSAVATIIFGGTAAVLYSFPTNLYALVPKNFTIIANALQISLAIITVVVFYYFKSDLYDDDGINAEYPSLSEAERVIRAMGPSYSAVRGTTDRAAVSALPGDAQHCQ